MFCRSWRRPFDNAPTNTVVDLTSAAVASVPHAFHVWKVNELVARLVTQIAGHEFVLGEWGQGVTLDQIASQPERIPEFRKQILSGTRRTRTERRKSEESLTCRATFATDSMRRNGSGNGAVRRRSRP